ncbi:uracil-DNA glycosylase [Metamycoplasma subdolum]|uniref:Uracil-DNA glycosylase n=1 Tax=Metamycoplasma subdolum TaxID=92407 RepID=A0A3M0AIX7_9BACT|nr:uracil-DNA glycosylase [Metamycoplasma subdolum]RMA79062.1 uracil-DNA glycosylase [Metamycoplasma subdolum]WPB50585.1 uracil-DNA glycosylase [Metamycoplasma subdolum]
MTFNFDEFLKLEKEKDYFKILEAKIQKTPYLPKKNEIFNAFKKFDFDNLKVIIIGQDPYANENVPDGLCFSTKSSITPASLRNIFNEIKSSYPNATFKSNSLESWKNQGVLLLNSILTVEVKKPLSHANFGWETFNLNLLEKLNENYANIVYVLLGKNAQNFVQTLSLKNQIILKAVHPSPLSAARGFFGSNIFFLINESLKKIGKQEIDWSTE